MMINRMFCGVLLGAFCVALGLGDAAAQRLTFEAHDTARAWSEQEMQDQTPQVRAAIEAVAWSAESFGVVVQEQGPDYDAVVRFASPRPSGEPQIDTVVMRWYRAAGLTEDQVAPAVLVVHTLHPDLPVATMLARGLVARGVHAFVIELPGYGQRARVPRRMTGVTALMHAAQAVGDCRRAYDVIGRLATVDSELIAIQGTSLGSFFATAAAAYDSCFDQVFLFLAGGDGVDILENGQKDAYHLRGALRHYGYNQEKLRALIEPVEPLGLAHRIDPQMAWMFNARDDTVIVAKNATLLAQAIGLNADHHVWVAGNHYTSFMLLPGILDRMGREIDARWQGD